MCVKCPGGSDENSIYPNCSCEQGQYNQNINECTKCVEGSTGIYPNCSCIEKDMVYNDDKNTCESCPPNSSGNIPNCICANGAGLLLNNKHTNQLRMMC